MAVAGNRLGKFLLAALLFVGADSLQLPNRVMASDGNGADPDKPAEHATLKPASATSPDIPFNQFDSQAEHELLNLVNQTRAQAGLGRLSLDPGLSKAARAHAEAMSAARELSHQFAGEPALPQRLAAATTTSLDEEGENVALDITATEAHRHLMQSQPHRANLLDPDYNVIGLGVIRSGDRLYIVQDFGHALPNYSLAEVKAQIAAAVAQTRRQAKQTALQNSALPTLDEAACSMAQADKLGTNSVHQLAQRYSVVNYTSVHPETLPQNSGGLLQERNVRSFSVGVCRARTETYPNGAYWVVLAIE